MKKAHIKNILKKGNLSPFMVAKLMFNDIWRNNHLQEPILSDNEKQSLVDKMPYDEYHKFKKWKNWFIEIDEVCCHVKEFYLLSESSLYQLLWKIDKDVTRRELRIYFENMYPQPVTEKQYHDLKRKNREYKLKEKYSITSCLIAIFEDKLPGPEKGLTLEDYIYEDEDFKPEDRKLIAEYFKNAVMELISFIDQGKIKPTRKAQLLPALTAALQKTPDQIAEVLLSGLYSDVEVPVKIFESSTITGEQLYKNFKEWVKYIDTFYPDTSGGYAIVQDINPLCLNKKGYYKPISPVEDLLNGDCEYFTGIENAHTFLKTRLNTTVDYFYSFQFSRMMLDVLSEKLSIPLNHELKVQAEHLEICKSILFDNLNMIAYSKNNLDERISKIFNKYENKRVEQCYPSAKVVEFCKSYINNMSEYTSGWFYDIKDFYMKEDRIKAMSKDKIKNLESMGNKEQVEHFRELVDAVDR